MNRGDICKAFLSVFCVANICFLTACKDEDVVKSTSGLVAFRPVADCEGNTRLSGTTWESGDQIGIYAYNSEGELASAVNANVRFLVNPQNNSCTAANADSTIWLSNDETYSVVAYYPYSTTDVQEIPDQVVDQPGGGTSYKPAYVINNWADQSDLTRLDLLWTSKSGITLYDADVSLNFAHQFSRVQINFTIDTDLSSLTADSLVGMKVLLSGKNYPTHFNLKTGQVIIGSLLTDSISFNMQHETGATTATATAIVLPDFGDMDLSARTITILLPRDDNRKFEFDVPSEIAFEKGKSYVWNVTFNTDATLSTNSFYVSASGNDSNTGKRNSPLATIARAIELMDDMNADFTIFIDGKVTGTQTISSRFTLENAKSVTITGANGVDPTNHQPKDTLDGNRSGRVISIESNVPVTFQNIMLINGRAQNGAGIYINDYSADVTVEDGTIIRDCLAEEKGGGIYANGNLSITGGIICKDTASFGAGIYVPLYDERFKVSVGGSVEISENVADQNGGGICVEGYMGQPVFLSGNARITGNFSVNQGGGISLLSASTLVMSGDAEITNNDAQYYGGGVFLDNDNDYGGCQLVMTGGTISTNRLIAGDAQGKGLYVTEGAAFTMGGAAYVASDNDVFLQGGANNAKIYIGSLLTAEAPVATITIDEDMAANPTVLTVGQLYVDGSWVDATTTVAENFTKFAISGNTGAINQSGVYLAVIDIDGVVSQITSMTESGTVTVSGYANEPDALVEALSGALQTLATNRPEVRVTLDMSGVLGMTSIGSYAFKDCSALAGIMIPSGVTSIGLEVFKGCSSLTSIEIPSSVTSINEGMFYGCSGLTSITIPSSVKIIGTEAFYDCSSLTSIEMPNSVKSIGNKAFQGCTGLTSIEIPSSVTSISAGIFYSCSSLTSIEIPSGVTSIGENAFYHCSSLTSIEIPSGVTSIGARAFEGCTGLTSITIPSSVTSIDVYAFYNCMVLTSIEIPSGVTSIGWYAFYNCRGLTSIAIPSSVTSIGNSAFGGCSGLTSITIPSSVTSIDDNAFYLCNNLTTVYYTGTEADRDNMTIEDETITGSGVTWYYNYYYGHAFVDLGLPSGLLWATCNVGASKPEGYGNYFAWGETTGYDDGKTTFDWSTYTLCSGSSSTMTKYCSDSYYGTVDNIATLELADDAANANWGGDWRMPTSAECQELVDNCSSEWVTDYNGTGVAGYLFTSNNNGNTLFLPAAGYRNDASLSSAGTIGYYWSSSLYESGPNSARSLSFGSSGYVNTSGISCYRHYGRSVRAVRVAE